MTQLGTEVKKNIEAEKALFLILSDTLNEEKEILRSSNLDSLWRLNKKKNDISEDIENERRKILELLDRSGRKHNLTSKEFSLAEFLKIFKNTEDYVEIYESCQELSLIKNNVYETQAANKMFVEEYLDVLEELVSIITASGNEKTYSRATTGPSKPSGMFLSQEV